MLPRYSILWEIVAEAIDDSLISSRSTESVQKRFDDDQNERKKKQKKNQKRFMQCFVVY